VLSPKLIKTLSVSVKLGGSVLGIGLFYLGFGLTNNLFLMMVSGFLLGGFNGIYNITAPTYFQTHIETALIGRFFSLFTSIMSITSIFGMAINGMVGSLFSPEVVLLTSGLLLIVVGIVSVFFIAFAEKKMMRQGIETAKIL
jgi:MFS family permease